MDDPADASISNDGRPEAQFGAELRSARERADLSLRALARILHRAHSSLVEYERGYRLAPVDVVREYESVLGLKPDALVALRNEAHAQRCALGRDGELPGRADPVPRPSDPASTSPRGRPRLRPVALAVAVAVAAVVVVVGYGLAAPGDKAKLDVATAPTQTSASAEMGIVADGAALYQLHSDGRIWRYVGPPGTGCQLLDNNPKTKHIAGAGGKLYQLHSTGAIWRYVGPPVTGWQLLDNNPASRQMAVRGKLCQIHANGVTWK